MSVTGVVRKQRDGKHGGVPRAGMWIVWFAGEDADKDADTARCIHRYRYGHRIGGHVIARRGEARRRTWDRGESRRLAVSVALNPQELRRATVRPVDGDSKAA